jgi:hypothetical protein
MAHLAYSPMGTGVISRSKVSVGRVNLSPSAQIKNSRSCTSNPSIRHYGVERHNFTCTHFTIQTVLKVSHKAISNENRNYVYKSFTLYIQKFNF